MLSNTEIYDLFLEESNRTFLRTDHNFVMTQSEYNGFDTDWENINT